MTEHESTDVSTSSDPVSTATYIIICSGRTSVYLAQTGEEALKAASDCAAQFAAYLLINSTVSVAQMRAVNQCQHEIMDIARTAAGKEKRIAISIARAKAQEMLRLLSDLEKQFPGL